MNPLVASFTKTGCSGGFGAGGAGSCTAPATVNFTDSSTGAQLWDYDWDCQSSGTGCNSFEDAGHTGPVNSHVYNAGGDYTPKLRVRRGTSEEHVFTHAVFTIGGSAPPPPPPPPSSLLVSGPTSGVPNPPLTFTATANGCTANTKVLTGRTVAAPRRARPTRSTSSGPPLAPS